jgi:hypothetical protein
MRIWHYLYFSNRPAADSLAEQLRGQRYEVEVRKSGPQWLILAEHEIADEQAALEAVAAQLGDRASAAGGEYDGWERALRTAARRPERN